MLVQLVIIATTLMMESKNLMWWVIFLKRKLKKKFQVVENLHLLEPILSVLRQSAAFFFKSLRKVLKIIFLFGLFVHVRWGVEVFFTKTMY